MTLDNLATTKCTRQSSRRVIILFLPQQSLTKPIVVEFVLVESRKFYFPRIQRTTIHINLEHVLFGYVTRKY
jgi:hypothetical protein